MVFASTDERTEAQAEKFLDETPRTPYKCLEETSDSRARGDTLPCRMSGGSFSVLHFFIVCPSASHPSERR